MEHERFHGVSFRLFDPMLGVRVGDRIGVATDTALRKSRRDPRF
jgi:hypothetical protein